MLRKEALAAVLAEIRQVREISQYKFPGVSRTYLQKIERGVGNPTISVLDDIAASLEIDPACIAVLISAKSTGRPWNEVMSELYQQLFTLEDTGVFDESKLAVRSEMRTPQHSPDLSTQMLELRERGLSHAEIAEHLEISKSSVQRLLKKLEED